MDRQEAASLLQDIKDNKAKLDKCGGHMLKSLDFSNPVVSRRTCICTRCGGTMNIHDAILYIKGYMHGTGGRLDWVVVNDDPLEEFF